MILKMTHLQMVKTWNFEILFLTKMMSMGTRLEMVFLEKMQFGKLLTMY